MGNNHFQSEQLQKENELLRRRLREAEDTIDAIHTGEVDAIVVDGSGGEQLIYSLVDANSVYHAIVNGLNEGVFTIDNDGNILFVNSRTEKILDRADNKIVGENFESFVQTRDRPRFQALLKEAGTGRSSGELNLIGKGENSGSVYLAIHKLSMDLPSYLCFVSTGLTSKQKYERILHEANLSHAIIDQATDSIIVFDCQGEVIRMNNAARQKISRDDVGFPLDELFEINLSTPEKSAATIHIVDKPFTVKKVIEGQRYSLCNAVIEKGDSTTQHIIFSAVPLINPDGTVIGGIVNMTDVTLLKKMESDLRQAQKMESIGNLAGGIAHDFNNILSSIMGFAELALDEAESGSDQEDDIREIFNAGNRAKELVKQILTFARQSEEELTPFKPSDIVSETLKLLRPSVPTSIEISSSIESNAFVKANTSQFHQVLLNLCTNAIQAMNKHGGTLGIVLKDITLPNTRLESSGPGRENYLELSVYDNGPGIKSDIMSKIFDPYFTTKGTGEGTGMGLAMAKGNIEVWGGEITVESEPNVKTVFTVRLPISEKHETTNSYLSNSYPLGKEHILLIDDEISVVKMGRRMFESLGYTVTSRSSSIEALELFKEKFNDIDLVISDMTMPHISGDDLSVELRKIKQDIPIIICSGYSNKMDTSRAKRIGINSFVSKPFEKSEIAVVLRRVLDEK